MSFTFMTIVLGILVLFVPFGSAFFPNNIGLDIPRDDFTLEKIARDGLLKVAASFLQELISRQSSLQDSSSNALAPNSSDIIANSTFAEDSNSVGNGSLHSSGNWSDTVSGNSSEDKTLLRDLDPLTESTLFASVYGGQVSARKFTRSIMAISTAAMKYCRFGDPAALFLNERIAEGLALVQSLRQDLTETLAAPPDTLDYDLVRELVGAVICAQSSFYSNTNWVETFESHVYQQLGLSTNVALALADPSLPTCADCLPVNNRYLNNITDHDLSQILSQCSLDCRSNVITGVGLTSGFVGNKPAVGEVGEGKCGYGGIFDAGRYDTATGGINKATSDRVYSPHYHLHQAAGKAAVEAIVELFLHSDQGLVTSMGERRFQDLMGLGTGVSLSIVMDTTGSMLDDVNGVIQQTEALVASRSDSVHLPESFIFVPFADPNVGPLVKTKNSSTYLTTLRGIVPNGGGDCPELSMEGVLTGLRASADYSELFIFTDAAAKDGDLANQVIATALAKRILPQFLLTGECEDGEAEFPDLYSTVAEKTGGNVFYSSKGDIAEAAALIRQQAGADKVSVAMFDTDGLRDYIIPVDSSIRDLSLFVSSGSGTYLPGMSFHAPLAGESVPTFIQTTNLVTYDVRNATAGNWRLHLDSPVPGLKIEVVGASSLDLHLQIFQTTENGVAFPVEGKPVAGSDVIFGVSVSNPKVVKNFTTLSLMDGTGKVILEVPVSEAGENFLTANVTIPRKGFRVMLTGTDTSGNQIRRLLEDFIEPQDFRLELEIPNPVRATPTDVIKIPYTLHRKGSEDENFTVTLNDESGRVNVTFVIAGNDSGVFYVNLTSLDLTGVTEQGTLSLLSTTTSGDNLDANYNDIRLYITNTSTVAPQDIQVEYILPTTTPPPTTPQPPTTTSLPATTKTGESVPAQADDTAVIVGAAVSSAAVLAGIVSFLSLKKWHRACRPVGPYNYPKPKPTVAKPNLRADYSY